MEIIKVYELEKVAGKDFGSVDYLYNEVVSSALSKGQHIIWFDDVGIPVRAGYRPYEFELVHIYNGEHDIMQFLEAYYTYMRSKAPKFIIVPKRDVLDTVNYLMETCAQNTSVLYVSQIPKNINPEIASETAKDVFCKSLDCIFGWGPDIVKRWIEFYPVTAYQEFSQIIH